MSLPSRHLLTLFASAIAGSCAHAPTREFSQPRFNPEQPSIWRLTHIAGASVDQDALMIFDGGLSLDVPCYRSSWALQHKAGALRFPNSYRTVGRCGEAVPEIVHSFDSAVQNVRSAAVDSDELSLLDTAGRSLFVMSRLEPSGLENRLWRITAYFDGSDILSTDAVSWFDSRRHFKPDVSFVHGTVFGSSGCGAFFGPGYKLVDDRVSISVGSLLAGWCSPASEQISNGVLQAMNGERIIDDHGDWIALRDEAGHLQIVLTALEANPLDTPDDELELQITPPPRPNP